MDTKVKIPQPRKKALFRTDPSRRKHFIYSNNFGSASQRFTTFQKIVFSDGFECLTHSGLVLGCLIGFDGLVAEIDIQAAYAACSQAFRWSGSIKINWLIDIDRDERDLSALTTLAIQRAGKLDSYDQAKADLVNFLFCRHHEQSHESAENSSLDLLLNDGLAWHQLRLPPVLFGHVNGAGRMSAPPVSAYAREESKRALKMEKADPAESAAPTQSSTAYVRAFESAMLGRAPTAFSGAHFIKKLIHALTPPAKGSNLSKRRSVREKLQKLAAELDDADETCALLYLFSRDLLESGTLRKQKLAPGTACAYLRSFAADFHAQANGQVLWNIDGEAYSAIYRHLLPESENAPSYKVAGLKAFHLLLRRWWQVPKLPMKMFQIDTDTPVASNILWPHELERLNQWIDSAAASRFVLQLKTAFSICGYAMVRIGEMMVLRCLNILDERNQFVIEISRAVRDGKEKSAEGKRRVFITDPAAVLTLRGWQTRRSEEGANSTDYFFGSPSEPLKIADRGKTYFWMNRLLKEVTGDESVSVHSMRHSVGSQWLKLILDGSGDQEVEPLDKLANEAGHVGGHITAVHYGHLYAAGIRQSIDRGLVRLASDYSLVSQWTGVREATLRQRVKRASFRGVDRTEALWSSVQGAAAVVLRPLATAAIPTVEPVNPLLHLTSADVTYPKLFGFITDMAAGLSRAQACLRQDLNRTTADQLLQLVGRFADRHGRGEIEMDDFLTLGFKALQQPTGDLLGIRPDFSRLAQPRWRLLVQAISRAEPAELSEAVLYWQRSLRGSHLAVRPGPGWQSFVALLKHSSMHAGNLALKYSPDAPDDARVADAMALAQATFRLEFGQTIPDFAHAYRAGRPAVWLVINSEPSFLEKNGSGSSITGLHCAMLTAHLWVALTKELKEKTT